MFRRIGLVLSLFLALVLLTGILGSAAWADQIVQQATGLLPATPAQAQWLWDNLPVVQKIRLNGLALERINTERQAKGLSKISAADVDIAPLGAEDVFSPEVTATPSMETTADVTAILPGAVDNSASPAFPPIRSQGGIGSCASWATTYYQMTYETNVALGRTASGGDNNVIFSPKWTYDMINGGVDAGSGFSDAYALEMQNGAATWADFPYDTNYLSWCMNPAAWSKAIGSRSQNFGQLYNTNIDTLLNDLKTQLANGHVVVIATFVYSWVQTVIANDPSTTGDDAFAGQKIASYATNSDQGGHGMTIVGYNDNIWTDLNGNGQVDPGEKGALKIANSWGTSDWNHGYRWVAYDALRPASNVTAAGSWPTANRSYRGIFWPGNMFTLTVTPNNPTLKAEVTLNTASRGQLAISLGVGDTTSTSPSSAWNSKAVYNSGGSYAFNGTGTAVDGTFYFDFSTLAKSVSGAKRWFVGVSDNAAGSPATVKSFKLYRATPTGDVLVATSSNAPKTVDAAKSYVWVDYALDSSNLPPAAAIQASPTTGQVPLLVTFDGSGSGDTDGEITAYSWNFGDGSAAATGAVVSHIYAASGTFSATLMVTDDKGATGSKNVAINTTAAANRPPVLAAIGNKTATAGKTLSFTISATDPDGNSLVYSAAYLPSGATFNPSTRAFTWTPTAAGTYNNVYFQVSDGSLIDYENISITVTKANQPPVLAAIGNKTATAGKTLSFTISATDPDGNSLVYSAAYLPSGATFNPSTRAFTWTPTAAGTYNNVYFQVSDGSLIDYENISITVTKANQPPVLAAIGNKTATAGKTLSFTISATDPDGNSLVYSAAYLPSGATFNPSTRAFTWTPTAAGTYYNIYFQVSDGSLTDYEYITITVNRATVINGQVSGTVKDIATGAGISGATVSDGIRSAVTGTSGAFTIASVPAGTYAVTVKASGYQNASQTVVVSAGQTATTNFNLQKSTSNGMWVDSITFVPGATDLTVKVKVVNPQPVANAQVMINLTYNGASGSTYFAVTGADGVASFHITPAPNGNYAVTVVYLSHPVYKWVSTQGVRTSSNVLSR